MAHEVLTHLAFALLIALAISIICRYLTGYTFLPLSFVAALLIFVSGPLTLRFTLQATLTLLATAVISYLVDSCKIFMVSVLGVIAVVTLWAWLMWVGVVERWKLVKENAVTS